MIFFHNELNHKITMEKSHNPTAKKNKIIINNTKNHHRLNNTKKGTTLTTHKTKLASNISIQNKI